MLLDTELYERIRRDEMKKIADDSELLRQAIIDNPSEKKEDTRNSLAWLDYWERRNDDERLRKEAKERRERWEERQHKRGALQAQKVHVGFQGELHERFRLHCDIPEQIMGFDLADEIFSEPESKYDSLTHYLRSRARM